MTPGGRPLSPPGPHSVPWRDTHSCPASQSGWRASGVTRLLPPEGLHQFASDHQLAGVSHPHPAPAQGPSPGVLASLSLSDGDRQVPFVPSPEDREQAGFMAAGPVHRASSERCLGTIGVWSPFLGPTFGGHLLSRRLVVGMWPGVALPG